MCRSSSTSLRAPTVLRARSVQPSDGKPQNDGQSLSGTLPRPQADGSPSRTPPSASRLHFAPLGRRSIPAQDAIPCLESVGVREELFPVPPPTSSFRSPAHSLLASAPDYSKDNCGKDASRASFLLAVSHSPIQRPLDGLKPAFFATETARTCYSLAASSTANTPHRLVDRRNTRTAQGIHSYTCIIWAIRMLLRGLRRKL